MSANEPIPYTGPSYYGSRFVDPVVTGYTATGQEVQIATQPGGSGGGGAQPVSPDDVSAVNPERFAVQMGWGWLSGSLLDKFGELWDDTGDAATAYRALQDTSVYRKTFAGIMRDDGTLRMDENAYLSTMAGYREALREFDMDPAKWEGNFVSLIEQEVGADELYRAAGQAAQRFREPGAADNGLADLFMQRFIDTGSAEVALEQVRASDAYGNVFAGNVRDDGTLRMDETEYFAYKRGWQRMFISRGLNPEVFEARGRLVDAVESEVSIQELDNRLTAVETDILGNRSEVADWFASQYGEGYSQAIPDENVRASVLAMAIDPEVGNDLLSNRISAAQIGGEAAIQGFSRSVERAEELARAGITQSQARSLYGEASARLSGLSATTARFGRGGTSLSDYEAALALGDARQQQRLTRALQSESSSFGARQDVRRDEFGLTGLRQR